MARKRRYKTLLTSQSQLDFIELFGFFPVHIQQNLEDEIVKEALKTVSGKNYSGIYKSSGKIL